VQGKPDRMRVVASDEFGVSIHAEADVSARHGTMTLACDDCSARRAVVA
jgi:hypothetical protein